MKIHSSNLARIMVCAGVVRFTDLAEPESSEYAEEGTACGELLQLKLEGKPIGTHASNGVAFDTDMQIYTNEVIEEIKRSAGNAPIKCEEVVDWVSTSGLTVHSRYDVSYIIEETNTLFVRDHKYGFGLVEVKENWQELSYAIGIVMKYQRAFNKIVLVIDQPRPHHEDGPYRYWEITYDQLLGYKKMIDDRLQSIVDGQNDLVTSPRCKYCKAGAVCPALNKAMYRGVEIVQQFVQDDLTDAELSAQLDLINRIEDVMKVRKDSIKDLAISRIKSGKVIPGYVLEQSYGNRTWKPDITPDVVEAMTGIKIIEEKMLSPAQAEKLGVSKKFVKDVTFQPERGPKLVRKDGADVGNKVFGTQAPKELIK